MVPVVVIRKAKGTKGAAIAYIAGGGVTEEERQEREDTLMRSARFKPQIAKMELFDALIANTRTPGTRLFTNYDERLHLVQHSRGFGLERSLPQAFLLRPISIEPDIFQRLQSLNMKHLKKVFRGLVEKRRLRALLDRRDKILEKIKQDRQPDREVPTE